MEWCSVKKSTGTTSPLLLPYQMAPRNILDVMANKQIYNPIRDEIPVVQPAGLTQLNRIFS
jgi:hypothetical protein